jgi:hypothetical protein
MAPAEGIPEPEAWERDLVRHAVERRFAEAHRDAVLAELARMRAWLRAEMGKGPIDTEQAVRFVLVALLEAVERSAGDPGFFAEQRYKRGDPFDMDRDLLYRLDLIVKDCQLMAKDVATLLAMLDVGSTRIDAMTALARKGEAAAPAVPRLVALLKCSGQLECCKVLRTLEGIGPPARDAVPAIEELANDADYYISQHARAALSAIAPGWPAG